jgi:hypothetical protein
MLIDDEERRYLREVHDRDSENTPTVAAIPL